jgi:hypothetical protein
LGAQFSKGKVTLIVYPKSELLFPHRSVADLEGLHGREWDAVVRRVSALPETSLDSLAFMLMMVHLCQCTKCEMGSYKASLGCSVCARRAAAGIGDQDRQWQEHLQSARLEIAAYLEDRKGEDRGA